MGEGSKGNASSKGDAPNLQEKPKPPKLRDLPKRPKQHELGDVIKANIDDIPTDIVNAIQNLDNTTEIIIKPSFVAPDTTAPQQ